MKGRRVVAVERVAPFNGHGDDDENDDVRITTQLPYVSECERELIL